MILDVVNIKWKEIKKQSQVDQSQDFPVVCVCVCVENHHTSVRTSGISS